MWSMFWFSFQNFHRAVQKRETWANNCFDDDALIRQVHLKLIWGFTLNLCAMFSVINYPFKCMPLR